MPKYSQKRLMPYTPQQMFALVADIEKYPQFLPWCLGAQIQSHQENIIVADLVIGYKFMREQFTSKVTLQNPSRIDVAYQEGPFNHLTNYWCFHERNENSCEVDFYVDFAFRSSFFQHAIEVFFNKAVKVMIEAFERRAKILYA